LKVKNYRWMILVVSIVLRVTLFQTPVSAQQNQQVYTASETWSVGHGEYIHESGIPACGQPENLNLLQTAADIIGAYGSNGIYGSLNAVLPQVVRNAGLGGTFGTFLDQFFGIQRYANCVPVSVVVPFGARIITIKYQASDAFGTGECVIGGDCEVGYSRFDAPLYFYSGNSQVISANFRNWSHDRTRVVTMTVYFYVSYSSPFSN
jgi:hypothetical protein